MLNWQKTESSNIHLIINKIMLSQILIAITIILLVLWGISIIFSKGFWKSVGGHVKDGIAKKISKVFIWLIFFAVIALIASLIKK